MLPGYWWFIIGYCKFLSKGQWSTHKYVKAASWSMALLNVPCRFMLGNFLQWPSFSFCILLCSSLIEGLIKYSHFCHPPIRTGNSVPRGTGISWSCPVLWYILPIFHQCLKCCNCRIHKSNIKLIIFASIYWIKISIDMKKYLQVSFYRIRRNKSCFIVNSAVHLLTCTTKNK